MDTEMPDRGYLVCAFEAPVKYKIGTIRLTHDSGYYSSLHAYAGRFTGWGLEVW